MSISRKKAARRHRRSVTEGGATVKSILWALPITVATGLLLLFIATALLMCASDPDRYHTVAGLALIYLTALIGGFAAVRLNRRSAPLLCGLGEGILLLVLLLAVGLLLPTALKSGRPTGITLLTHGALLLAALIGALLGARPARDQRKRKRR